MKRKLLSILLSLCILLSLPPVALAADTGFSDMPAEGYWSHAALTAAAENGLLQGDNGRIMPGEKLTRAQLAAIINRAFGAEDTADIGGFTDVSSAKWYYSDIAKAVRMGTLTGSGGGKMRPDDYVTREEAFAVLARAVKLTAGDAAALNAFSDYTDVSGWAAESLTAMVQAGYVGGENGKLNPEAAITREQFAQVMYNMFSHYITKAGTYTENMTGNVIVNTDKVMLSGLTITGDLIIGEGVGNGDFTLDGVTVTGRVIVRGGGENSIHIINSSNVGSIVVGKTGDGGVRVHTEEGCRVEIIYIDDGLDDIILVGTYNQVTVATDTPVVLKDAKVTGLTISGSGAEVKLEGSTSVTAAKITEAASGSMLEVGSGTKIAKVESAAEGILIEGQGTVTQATVSGSNTAVNTSGTKVTAEAGTTGVTQNGTAVDPSSGTTTPSGGVVTYGTTVESLNELKAALANSSVDAITVRGVVEIPAGETITFTKPVTIADLKGSMLIIAGTLINNSTFVSRGLGGMFEDTGVAVEGSFINNGTFTNESRFAMFEAAFTNNGRVNNLNWFHCGGGTITNNGSFNSIGDITLQNSSAFDDSGSMEFVFTNAAGATFVAEGPGSMLVRLTCEFFNAGTATVSGYMENYGRIENTGSFTYTGYMLNAGAVTGTLTKGSGGQLENDIPVSTLAALNARLSALDAGYDGIAIVGDITLGDDLSINRHVRITPDGALIVPSGYKLTVTSTSGYNGLDVSGKLELSGTLVTTRSGSGEDELVGQVTLLGGALRASNGAIITNSGVIQVRYGDFNLADGVTFSGNPVDYVDQTVIGVSSEAALRVAMESTGVEEITIEADITLTANLNITKRTTITYDTETSSSRTLTVPADTTVTVKTEGQLSILGSIVNNGTVADDASGHGIFMGSTGTFRNNGTLNVKKQFDILEGELINNGTVDIYGGNTDAVMLVMGGKVTNNNTFINDCGLHMDVSTGLEGAVYNRSSTFTNTGSFTNGSISRPASDAYLGMAHGTFANTGDFINNGQTDIAYSAFSHTGEGSSFTTYNTKSLSITGGSFSTIGAPENSFSNAGYMRVIDQFGKGGQNAVCKVTLGDDTLNNTSNWIDYTAEVYSEAGLIAAETAQQEKIDALGNSDNFYGFSLYTRLNFMNDVTVNTNTTLQAFGSYWVEAYYMWDGSNDVLVRPTLTVAADKTLTVARNCSLNIGGSLVNSGMLKTAAPLDDDPNNIHEPGGRVEIWPSGSFANNGTLTNGGDIFIRHEFAAEDEAVIMPKINGLGSVEAKFVAEVHNKADLLAANASTEPVYLRIEIKGDSLVELSADLTIDKDLYIEPGSSLIVDHGFTLVFSGNHNIDNGGDMSVFGGMTIGSEVCFNNRQNLGIGAASGAEAATVTVSAGGSIYNEGSIIVYATGTLNASAGSYNGNPPNN